MEPRRSWPSSRRGGWDDCRVGSASGNRVLRAARDCAHGADHSPGAGRGCRAARTLLADARTGAGRRGPVRRSGAAADRPPRAGPLRHPAPGEQVVSFPPQPVITEDNLVVQIDSVIYYQVTDAKAASYEIANFIQAIEQLTVTTLRNVIGGMTLEQTLTSRDSINSELRIVLDEATGKWGIRVNRVELKAVDPPVSIQEAMEKQMRAESDRRAAILQAEGIKQSQILTAEGEKQSAILRAEGQRESQRLYAEGQAKAIETVFNAIHEGDPDPKLLAYQYLQMLPEIAKGDANKVWVIPSEITTALGNIGPMVENVAKAAQPRTGGTPPAVSPPPAGGQP